MRLTNFIKEHAEDIRNNINEAVKYYTPKQAVKILQQNLAEIPEYDDKCIAVYKALDFHYSDLAASNNKLIVKSYDEYERYPSDRQYKSRAKKFDDFKVKLFKDYIDNDSIERMYNKGKELIRKQEELEVQKKREAEELAKSKLYKETVDKYPGLHEMVKFQAIYDFWRNNHLWTVVGKGESFGGFIEELINKYRSKIVLKKDCEPGKVYVLAAGQPNLYNAKGWDGEDVKEAPDSRYNIILKGSVLKCIGDGVFDVVAGLTYYGYSYEEWNKKTLNQKLDQDCGFILLSDLEKDLKGRGKELTDKWAKDVMHDDKEYNDIWAASPRIKKLINQDTL